MSSISGIMDSALSGLQTQQVLIDVVNSNISNVSTDGYSRQAAVVTATSYNDCYTGTSVEITEVKRVIDLFTSKKLNSTSETCSELETELKYLESLEAVFDESEGSGLSEVLSDFFNAWQNLSNDASGTSERSTLVSESQSLASTLNEMYSNLEEIRTGINDDITSMVDDINSKTTQIADLNQKISEGQSSGLNVNSYLDQRDSLITELSELVDINYTEDDDGQVYIQLSNGKSLVRGSSSWSLETHTNTTTGMLDVIWKDRNNNEPIVTDDITSGALGGAIDIRDNVIPEYLESLDKLAAELIERVNTLHESGYDLNGDEGLAFFTGTGASDIAVNEDIVEDSDLIAVASSADSVPGDSTIATEIYKLQKSSLMNSNTSTFEEYYTGLVSDIGSMVNNTESSSNYQSNLKEYYNNYRESISGVSSDEEMANLVLYQSTYEACAKVMSTLDELLETLLQI